MFKKLGFMSVFTLSVMMAFTGPGCDNAADRAYDCDEICDKYKACVDPNYDDGACGSRCRDKTGNSAAAEDKADACQDCIDDRSCAGAVFGCGIECAEFVP
ncbi:MAG: hypothetical protein M4D80_08255 [Myxococcota bacterium]|nr:hypothetical protein [Myxococcota bacterium]